MEKKIQILYIEDNPDDARLVEFSLKKSGLLFDMLVVSTEKDFLKGITEFDPDLILSDHSLPGFSSTEAFKITCEQKPETPFVLITGSVSEEFAVECLLSGMDDYILKSNLIRLPSSIDRILSKRKMKEEKHVVENLLEELQTIYRQLEIKNKEIMDSINYAKRLQDAILPNERFFDKFFHKDFIIYHPRDVVSGDFYWLTRTTAITDDSNIPLKILAAFDCTGHGIPGAFMSLLTSVLLNDAIKNSKMTLPSEALAYLNQKLPAILNRNNVERIADGMDIALCAFDLFTRTLYFSGANRPLWIVRKNAESILNIIEYKGTKASIGAYTSSDQKFENHVIQMKAGDRVFMFTDGVTDQFGGPAGKKMGRKRLKEIILRSSAMEMAKQKKHLLNVLMEWKGVLEQVDDMLLIGIEIS